MDFFCEKAVDYFCQKTLSQIFNKFLNTSVYIADVFRTLLNIYNEHQQTTVTQSRKQLQSCYDCIRRTFLRKIVLKLFLLKPQNIFQLEELLTKNQLVIGKPIRLLIQLNIRHTSMFLFLKFSRKLATGIVPGVVNPSRPVRF